jgi:hypothetical protein
VRHLESRFGRSLSPVSGSDRARSGHQIDTSNRRTHLAAAAAIAGRPRTPRAPRRATFDAPPASAASAPEDSKAAQRRGDRRRLDAATVARAAPRHRQQAAATKAAADANAACTGFGAQFVGDAQFVARVLRQRDRAR